MGVISELYRLRRRLTDASIVGYTWFIGPMQQPSPIYFGDALAEIERFLWDEVDRQSGQTAELPFLLGVEQGAIMALAAAAAVPDLLSGVIAIDGFLPIVPGWEPPLAPLDRLPILIVNESGAVPPANVLSGSRLVETLKGWGAEVELADLPSGSETAPVTSAWLARQHPRVHRAES